MNDQNIILGAGMTGLAAGCVSGLPIFEATDVPGGICASYYIRPGEISRLHEKPADGEAYRFEIGGGHWIFGGDPAIKGFVQRLTRLNRYVRRSSVYFREQELFVPYPLQNHLRFLDKKIVTRALMEIAHSHNSFRTMQEWLEITFGRTLCDLFFFPFHELYTAGLYTQITPQDVYKSPVNLELVIQGALQDVPSVGYNTRFAYPATDLNTLAKGMANRCDVRYGKRAVNIDIETRQVHFADGSNVRYHNLISTLPLKKVMDMTGLHLDMPADPFTSVLVLNIGAIRGKQCPDDHWLYNSDARSGFHRVGFYSNVDSSFLIQSSQERKDRVSIYVERTYPGGKKPAQDKIQQYVRNVVAELQEWQFIRKVEVADPTWVEVAYTWSPPDSRWKEQALQGLADYGIYQVGRYGRWAFQGIADSIRDGFIVGASLKGW